MEKGKKESPFFFSVLFHTPCSPVFPKVFWGILSFFWLMPKKQNRKEKRKKKKEKRKRKKKKEKRKKKKEKRKKKKEKRKKKKEKRKKKKEKRKKKKEKRKENKKGQKFSIFYVYVSSQHTVFPKPHSPTAHQADSDPRSRQVASKRRLEHPMVGSVLRGSGLC